MEIIWKLGFNICEGGKVQDDRIDLLGWWFIVFRPIKLSPRGGGPDGINMAVISMATKKNQIQSFVEHCFFFFFFQNF
jgi:hypothetical protein